jgi:hypothetical protein
LQWVRSAGVFSKIIIARTSRFAADASPTFHSAAA